MPSIAGGELTSIAWCWRLERRDGAGLALTSHDQALDRDGVSHAAGSGLTPAAITRTLGLEPGSSEVSGSLKTGALTEADLTAGRWNGARMQLTAVNWMDPAAAPITLLAGEIATVASSDGDFSAELMGAAARLEAPVCPATSAECRAQFGDKQCRVDLAGRSVRAAIIAVDAARLSLDRTLDERFVLGRLRYVSGPNCGLETVVLHVEGTNVTVRDLPRAEASVGNVVEIREGCDKRFETCVDRFANGINFRGEPHLPGTDLLTRYPGA